MRIYIPFLFFVSTTVIPVPVLAPSSLPPVLPYYSAAVPCNEQVFCLGRSRDKGSVFLGKGEMGEGGAGKEEGFFRLGLIMF